jgi:hypothetical protein
MPRYSSSVSHQELMKSMQELLSLALQASDSEIAWDELAFRRTTHGLQISVSFARKTTSLPTVLGRKSCKQVLTRLQKQLDQYGLMLSSDWETGHLRFSLESTEKKGKGQVSVSGGGQFSSVFSPDVKALKSLVLTIHRSS